ncbi:MAG: hypothetical protein V4690_00085 [Patescibacteria group bacterium]
MIAIDLDNPPQKIRLTIGVNLEVTCRRHFLKRFKKEETGLLWGFVYIDKVEEYQGEENCFDCTHNP